MLGGFAREVGRALERLVQIGDVRGVMFVVMDFHRLSIDVRFERVGGVGERRKFVGHGV